MLSLLKHVPPSLVGVNPLSMTGAEAAGLGNLVMGRCMIVGESLCVLYDSGATHSFVSIACMERLGLLVREPQ